MISEIQGNFSPPAGELSFFDRIHQVALAQCSPIQPIRLVQNDFRGAGRPANFLRNRRNRRSGVADLYKSCYAFLMSTTAIQQVMRELERLPDSDHELVLGFLQALNLKQKQAGSNPSPTRRGRNPAQKVVDGLLVFTGEFEGADVDWLKVVRDERDQMLLQMAVG